MRTVESGHEVEPIALVTFCRDTITAITVKAMYALTVSEAATIAPTLTP
jgi:hypothetical protein